MYPNELEYKRLAESHDLIPVYLELLADVETPVSVLRRFADRENAFLLESIEGDAKWARYSFVGVDPELLLEVDHSRGSRAKLDELRDVFRDVRVAEIPGLPRFIGGAVGFIGYEAVAEFERMPEPKSERPFAYPTSRFLKVDKLIVFDNFRHTIKLVFCSRPELHGSIDEAFAAARAELEAMRTSLSLPFSIPEAVFCPEARFTSNMTQDDFCGIVERAKKYICDGDIIQVVLSRRLASESSVPPLQLYRALRLLNPSPYTFFLKIGGHTLVGSSPEVMVRLTGNKVELRPIAGTRPRGATEQEDRQLADQLLSDEKEKAEHVMLVDLGRNDLGRISEIGSVQVTEFMLIERYSHVMHIVSHVEGILRGGLDAYDVIAATFPAGTLTGAPKIRAMEIIHELEDQPRGAYGGAVGYISYGGNLDLAITIRTLEIMNGAVSVQVGAGIVYDSIPEHEFEETGFKAQAAKKAVDLAANGLDLSRRSP
jgi:anthranilate synthase component 1